ncbi:MAG TPA: phasin family protein [Rubricoccaceae bacterium]|nr:phasin family protein [Rubricoccaceae bacterium]
MAKKGKKRAPTTPDDLAGRAREVWLAGLGALQAARKGGAGQFDALVERGARLRHEAADGVERALERLDHAREAALHAASEGGKAAGKKAARAAGALGERIEATVETALREAGVPRRKEVHRLREEIEALRKRVARLAGPTLETAELHVVPRDGGWIVEGEGASADLHATKKLALVAARRLARAQAPCRLVVHKKDGSEGETLLYEA